LAARPLPVCEMYSSTNWSANDQARLAPYRVLGTDGAGNPICIEEDSGAIWLLDHEDRFRTRQFVNSGIPQLAECLLARMGEKDAERFRDAVFANDPLALTEGSFWWHEAAVLPEE